MKNYLIPKLFALLFIMALLNSCTVVGGIFKAGMGVGIFIVVAIIALIIFLIARIGNKK